MMKLITSTIIRRLTLIALAAFLGYLGIGQSHALDFPPSETFARVCITTSTNTSGTCSTRSTTSSVYINREANTSGTTQCQTTLCAGPFTHRTNDSGSTFRFNGQLTGTCPSNSTYTSGQCRPNSGFSSVNDGSGNWTVKPTGSECTSPSVYNPTTGTCGAPPCTGGIERRITITHSIGVEQTHLFPPNICNDSCEYNLVEADNSDCFTSFQGSTSSNLYCTGNYESSTSNCTSPTPNTATESTTPPAPKICPANQYRDQDGKCYSFTVMCPADQVRDNDGICQQTPCNAGFQRVPPSTACTPIPPTPITCTSGNYLNSDNQCVPNKPTNPNQCSSGQTYNPQTGDCQTPTSGTNYDGSTDYDSNPSTIGGNEPGNPLSNTNFDGTFDHDNNPSTGGQSDRADSPSCVTNCSTGTGGSGSGSGSGSGDNAGKEDTAGSSAIYGSNTIGYTPSGKSFQGVMQQFASDMADTGLGSSINGFFTLNIASSSCPILETTVLQGLAGSGGLHLLFDQHCSSMMDSFWPLIQGVMIAVASFVAFRIAVIT